MKTLKVNREWYLEYGADRSTFLSSLGNSVVTENIIPWLTSFNNISLVETKTEEHEKIWFLDFGAKDMLLGISAKTGVTTLDVMIYLYRKNFEKINNSYDNYFSLFAQNNLVVSNNTSSGGHYYTLSRNFFIITKENNLIALFEGGSYDLPDDKSFIIFDEDNFGEKYIAISGSFKDKRDMAIFYFNNELPIIYMGRVVPEKFSEENYLVAKKVHINYYKDNNNYNDFHALSTNILNISNISLETDKNTAHKLIEVNGVRYRKIIYNIWIEDND